MSVAKIEFNVDEFGGQSEKFRCGFIDQTGLEVVTPQYHQVGIFNEGLAVVYKLKENNPESYFKETIGYINLRGELVIPIKFDRITPNYAHDDQYDPNISTFYKGKAFAKYKNKIVSVSN